MLRVLSTAAALTIGAVLLAAASPAADKPFPQVIKLPTGFQPEGIEVGRGTTFYVGSVANGAIYRGNLRTGTGSILVSGATGNSATGIEFDNHNRLWVAGGMTGTAWPAARFGYGFRSCTTWYAALAGFGVPKRAFTA